MNDTATDTATQAKISYSPYNMLSRELLKRDFEIEFLPLSEKYIVVTAPNGKRWISRWTSLSYPFVSTAAKLISVKKNLAYEFAESQGISAPQSMYVTEFSEGLSEFLEKYAPVVVKPVDSSGSRGLTLNVTDEEQLRAAITHALDFSETAIVQRQFTGSELRITVIEGKAESVILRQPPQLVGDGESTIAELLVQENEARKDLQFDPIPYPMLTSAIIPEDFFTDRRVPEKGEVVELSKNSLTKGGASLYEISGEIHPSYLAAAEKLANSLNPEFLVVDFMIADYLAPLTDDNYIFVEFNSAPSLRLYFGMRNGKQYDMPAKIADMIEKWSRK